MTDDIKLPSRGTYGQSRIDTDRILDDCAECGNRFPLILHKDTGGEGCRVRCTECAQETELYESESGATCAWNQEQRRTKQCLS